MEKLSKERLKKIEKLVLNPPPGSKVAAAKEFGIDLTLVLGQLRKTPQERLDDLQKTMRNLEEFSRQGAEWRNRKRDRT